MVTIDADRVVETVYERYVTRQFPLDEKGVAFLLGYHLDTDQQYSACFEVGWTGTRATSFSPDVDVLANGDTLIAYEVKGLRSDQDQVSKRQLYTGLRQAISLLNQPSNVEGSALKHTYLAIPASSDATHKYLDSIVPAIEQTPVGVVTISSSGIDIVREPAKNTNYRAELQSRVISELHEQSTGTDVCHPEDGLRSLALEIVDNRGEKQLLL